MPRPSRPTPYFSTRPAATRSTVPYRAQGPSFKAIRVSVGAVFRVPFARFEHIDGFLGLLGRHGFRAVALSPRGRTDIGALERQDRMALVLGTEGEGLPEALLSHMETARIAMASGFDSLNVAAASAIALHRLADAARSG